jgi:hypothetical protein
MGDADSDEQSTGARADLGSVRCSACKTALRSPGRDTISFLLIDRLTVPVVGCSNHLQQFREVCELTTRDAAELLNHRPAGGVRCPSCRRTHQQRYPVVPVADGAVAILGCSRHMDDIVGRFRAGLRTRHRLTMPFPVG